MLILWNYYISRIGIDAKFWCVRKIREITIWPSFLKFVVIEIFGFLRDICFERKIREIVMTSWPPSFHEFFKMWNYNISRFDANFLVLWEKFGKSQFAMTIVASRIFLFFQTKTRDKCWALSHKKDLIQKWTYFEFRHWSLAVRRKRLIRRSKSSHQRSSTPTSPSDTSSSRNTQCQSIHVR